MDALTKKMDVDVCFVLNNRVMVSHATNVLSRSAHEMRPLSNKPRNVSSGGFPYLLCMLVDLTSTLFPLQKNISPHLLHSKRSLCLAFALH